MEATEGSLFVYSYEHIDELGFARTPSEAFPEYTESELAEVVTTVQEAFQQSGWEGDGNLNVLWIPPFIDTRLEFTSGTRVWHVKQKNNGISWLACSEPLMLEPLLRQNSIIPRGAVEIGILDESSCRFKADLAQMVQETEEEIVTLEADVLQSSIGDRVVGKILRHVQGRMVARLQEYLDDCYLTLLHEVIVGGNRADLKLRKLPTKLALDTYQWEGVIEADAQTWFTLSGVVSDAWAAFRFLPFNQKTESLCGAFGLKLDPSLKHEMRKNVLLRNCIEHNDGQVGKDILRKLGVTNIQILNGDALEAHSKIEFTLEEIRATGSAGSSFAECVMAAVNDYTTLRHYKCEGGTWIP